MTERYRTAFFAFPSEPADLRNSIEAAGEIAAAKNKHIGLTLWPTAALFGTVVPDEIRNKIRAADVVACDITRPNLNVYYEAGFAIGSGKAVAPVVNTSFAAAVEDLRRDGIFDNIGYGKYENALELSVWLGQLPTAKLVELYAKPLNTHQPLFLLDAFRKTDFRNAIVSTIKESKVFFRSFDPVEIPRFQTVDAIADATSSSGVIIPFLASHIDDAQRHNLRAAFLAGICHGYERQTLLLQLPTNDPAQPADFRDLVTSVRNEEEIREVVKAFAGTAILATQSIVEPRPKLRRSVLQTVTLGARAAENEFRSLEAYFVETAEFLRTLRGDAHVVAGRKGSGKTAIFFMVRDRIRNQRKSIVTDLKPESHQLSLFREELLKLVEVGVFDHTLAAFWHFLILTEILFAIRRQQTFQSRFDYKALAAEAEIDKTIQKYRIGDTGDFTFRISRLGNEIVQEIQRLKKTETISAEKLTNIIFRGAVGDIRALIAKYSTPETKIVLLFDNIDKGWPANGVDKFDARLVRLLLEALEKLRSDFATQDRHFLPIIFLRNDIYELLLDETPDRGKTAEVRIDWTDRVKLRQVIYRRLQASVQNDSEPFQQLWERFFVPRVGKQDAIDYFIDHSLMRPRFLINIVENAISNGINRVHDIVLEEDCIDAVRQHANYLMDDFGYEIRDVSGMSADILYALSGVKQLVTRRELIERFADHEVSDPARAFDLMLWYGLLGIAEDSGNRYIYDFDYNLKRLEAGLEKDETLYTINPAIAVALHDGTTAR